MDLTGEGVSVYSEAKGEYTKQLCQYMLPALQQYFLDMMDEAKQKEPNVNKVLLMFQQILEGVPEWNADKVQRETSALTTMTHCDYLEELLTAVFIAHTKVLSAIRLTSKQKKLQITIPRLEHFLHRTMIECSRLLWSNTYLFSTAAPSMERQKNLRHIEGILHDGIQQAIRSMLPVKNILREYLKEDDDDDEEEETVEAAVEAVEPVQPVKVVEPVEPVQPVKVEDVPEVVEPMQIIEDIPEVVEPEKVIPKLVNSEELDIGPKVANSLEEVVEPEKIIEPPTQPFSFTGMDTSGPQAPDENIQILDESPVQLDGLGDLGSDMLSMDFEVLA
jgi:hypothetical protein